MQQVPVAASVSTASVLTGPPRPVSVVAVTPMAVYLSTEAPFPPALCLAAPEAVRVPCALVCAGSALMDLSADAQVGVAGTAGDGAVFLDGVIYRVGRWWRPPRPRVSVPDDGLRRAAGRLAAAVPDPLDQDGRAALDELTAALSRGDGSDGGLDSPVRRLLGRGPGLTPVGDDVLAGAMVCLAALGTPRAAIDRPTAALGPRAAIIEPTAALGPRAARGRSTAFARLDAVVTAAAPATTTTVSVALLAHAARGECVPQLAALLEALASPASGSISGHGEGTGEDTGAGDGLDRAIEQVLAVGHSSGAGLVHGVAAALATRADTPMERQSG